LETSLLFILIYFLSLFILRINYIDFLSTNNSKNNSLNSSLANNIVLWSYKENTWIVAEVTGKKVWYRTFLKNNYALVSTNYFLSDKMFDQNRTFWKDRYMQYHEKLWKFDFMNLDRIKEIVSYYDGEVSWWWTIANKWTVQSVIINPKNKKLFIANWKTPPVTLWEFVEVDY